MKNVLNDWDQELFYKYCKDWNLPINKNLKSFSKGMKMKLSIATALAHHPQILILDEATSGLDPISRSDILEIFADFIQDESHSILFSSHITSDLEKIADYVVFIHEGKILFQMEKDVLLENHGILKVDTLDDYSLANVVKIRKNSFGIEALIDNRDVVSHAYPSAILDHATIDDIMLYYVKGESL